MFREQKYLSSKCMRQLSLPINCGNKNIVFHCRAFSTHFLIIKKRLSNVIGTIIYCLIQDFFLLHLKSSCKFWIRIKKLQSDWKYWICSDCKGPFKNTFWSTPFVTIYLSQVQKAIKSEFLKAINLTWPPPSPLKKCQVLFEWP